MGLAQKLLVGHHRDHDAGGIPILRTLVAATIGHAMAHNISHQLRELITDAGFTVTDTGDLPLLGYVKAQRPQGR